MLKIPRIDYLPQCVGLTDVSSQAVTCNNWAADYPYAPKTIFSAAHNGTHLFLTFRVDEDCTMAMVETDNGPVWTDSAVEFFISFDDTGYYNFEFSCIGKALLGFRKTKPNVTHAGTDIMATIQRGSTLGETTFAERTAEKPYGNHWELTVSIPATAFFAHAFTTLDGLTARANVYKCGDGLSKPHYVSWQPIDLPSPNFHVPQFFGNVEFE